MSSETTSTFQTFSTVLAYKIILWGMERCIHHSKWEIHDISIEDVSNLVYFCFHEVNTWTDFKHRKIKIIYVNWSTYVRKNEYINLTVV